MAIIAQGESYRDAPILTAAGGSGDCRTRARRAAWFRARAGETASGPALRPFGGGLAFGPMG